MPGAERGETGERQITGDRMRRAIRIASVLTALATVLPASSRAQDPGVASENRLTLDEAVARALETHPALGTMEARLDGAKAGVGEARAAWFPSLRLSGSVTRFEEPMTVAPLHGFNPQQPPAFDETLVAGEATAAYTLFDGGARGARIEASRAEHGAAAAEVERVRTQLIAGVAGAYLRVVGNHEVLQAHQKRLAALESEESRVRALLEEGQAPEIHLLRVQAALLAARAEAVGARSALETAELDLARLLDLPPDLARRERLVPVALSSGSAAVPPREAALERVRSSNPRVAAAERAAAAAEAGVSVARSAHWPTLDAFGSYWERGGGDTDFQGEWAAGLKISVPLFTGGAVRSRVARAEAGSRAAREQVRQVELEGMGEVDAALARVEETAARVTALAAAVERQEAVVAVERVSLEVGAGVQTDYLDAEADLLEARGGLARARHALVLARVDLARVLGELDETWIADNLESR